MKDSQRRQIGETRVEYRADIARGQTRPHPSPLPPPQEGKRPLDLHTLFLRDLFKGKRIYSRTKGCARGTRHAKGLLESVGCCRANPHFPLRAPVHVSLVQPFHPPPPAAWPFSPTLPAFRPPARPPHSPPPTLFSPWPPSGAYKSHLRGRPILAAFERESSAKSEDRKWRALPPCSPCWSSRWPGSRSSARPRPRRRRSRVREYTVQRRRGREEFLISKWRKRVLEEGGGVDTRDRER